MYQKLLLEPLANGLILFYRLFGGNMGLAIIFFSLTLRILLNPLTKPYLESMKKMKEIAPQLEKIKKRHGGDKTKYLQAQADFYKEKGINPSGGCLPYLLQIIILIAFFNVFSRTLISGTDIVSNFNNYLYPALKFGEGAQINTQFLYLNITEPDTFRIPGLGFSFPGPFLILAALAQFVSAKISAPFVEAQEKKAKKTKTSTDDISVAMQGSMIYAFPVMTLLIGFRFASGLVLYWFLFSAYQALQQYQTSGWGGLTPFIKRIGLLKSEPRK